MTSKKKSGHIFISWSKPRTKSIAKALKSIIEDNTNLKAFYSEDLRSGEDWFSNLKNEISDSTSAIVLLSPENISSPWLHYEIGALKQKCEEVHFVYCFGLQSSHSKGAVRQYQGVNFSKETIENILISFGETKETIQNEIWNKFDKKYNDLYYNSIKYLFPNIQALFNRKTFQEDVHKCTNQRWIDRLIAIENTLAQILEKKESINSHAKIGHVILYNKLIKKIDQYKMHISTFLLQENEFKFKKKNYHLKLPKRIKDIFISDLSDIKTLAGQLVSSPPIHRNSYAYEDLDLNSFDQKKKMFLHPLKFEILHSDWTLSYINRLFSSTFEFDRIAAYQYVIEKDETSICEIQEDIKKNIVEAIKLETEKLNSKTNKKEASSVALYYALKASKKLNIKIKTSTLNEAKKVEKSVLKAKSRKPIDSKVFTIIKEIKKKIHA